MRKLPWYMILIVLFLGLYSLALYMKPVKTDWTPTLVNKDKIPYGTYVFFHELNHIFKSQPIQLRITPSEFYADSSQNRNKEVYMFISPTTDFSSTDVEALLNYVKKGNQVFISSEELGQKLSDTLKVDINHDYLADSITTRLVNPLLISDRFYGMPKTAINAYLASFDTSRAVVLGMNNKKQVNYIVQEWGKGRIFINTVPAMYTNYSLLDQGNRDYVAGSLSYLRNQSGQLYWDEFFKQGRVGKQSPLRVILENASLKAAFFTALVSIIVFMLFQSKRRQRIIPIIVTPANSTIDFVETVSQVYLNNSNHRNIAMKQINYFFEHIRSRYHLDTNFADPDLAKKIAQKSGFQEQQASKMMELIRYIRSEEKISDQHLLKLNNYIQEFHKQSNQ